MTETKKLTTCNRCGQEIYFGRNDKGRFIPLNPDDSDHFQTCDRAHLFGKSSVECYNCETHLFRESGQWISLGGSNRWSPSRDFRSLECPSCGWFYSWDEKRENLSYQEVESHIKKEQLKYPGFQFELAKTSGDRGLRIIKE